MEQREFMQEEQNLREVKEFVGANIVEADNSRVECGDGRYTYDQSQGAIRVFGGDFGIIMAVAAALKKEGIQMDTDEIVFRYLQAVKKIRGEDARLYYHTDSDHPIPGIGCGHAEKASDLLYEKLYFPLKASQVKDLYESFVANPSSEVTVLEGKHKEKGVLLVYGKNDASEPEYSVNSSDSADQYFVLDLPRTSLFIKDFFPQFSKDLPKYVGSQSVMQAYLSQIASTAHLLAEGLPQYKVAIANDRSFSITPLAKVN